MIEPEPARLAANFHLLFNLALAILFIGLLGPLARLCRRLLPTAPVSGSRRAALHLRGGSGHAGVALAEASRETLRMADIVEAMLRDLAEALRMMTANARPRSRAG